MVSGIVAVGGVSSGMSPSVSGFSSRAPISRDPQMARRGLRLFNFFEYVTGVVCHVCAATCFPIFPTELVA